MGAETNKEDLSKKVDESWKEAVSKDKKDSDGKGMPEMPEASFGLFLSGLFMEALIALGDVEHPISKKKELSLPHAKFIIETMSMLKDKTKNNLTPDEGSALEGILYDLRMKFVAKAGK
jgi:hypothetical protein